MYGKGGTGQHQKSVDITRDEVLPSPGEANLGVLRIFSMRTTRLFAFFVATLEQVQMAKKATRAIMELLTAVDLRIGAVDRALLGDMAQFVSYLERRSLVRISGLVSHLCSVVVI